LDILFGSSVWEKMCHDDTIATRTLGPLSARRLRNRLDDLSAAACLGYAAKLPGRFHLLKGDRAGQFALHLHGAYRLVIAPANDPLPRRANGGLDVDKVTAITVIYIGNYHD
jgi:toxin HigB-1